MNKLIELEIAYAMTQGYTNFHISDSLSIVPTVYATPPDNKPGDTTRESLPKWAREWTHTGSLMSIHGISLTYYPNMVYAGGFGIRHPAHATFETDAEKDVASRVVILQAIMRKLEAKGK